ncbi:antibiotic biosynthesis monooxygenase [Lutibacter sp.]|uniref:antibiotic biosynthesis monooxygenase family protein n=1 Tax=Lutibacter sp. TaxID=1925666 RepID=UPI0025C6DF16|nr:antibiotic biosynthesis monooxygenase [Lutibacter sp.]MCF6167614.1 antibiotic biosynthesis monooxygenase [Lutibacter sp.]
MIANTPKPPYYAVIFSSISAKEEVSYSETSDKMIELAQQQEGFLGMESAKNEIGITVSYWDSLEAIKNWKMNVNHVEAREKGRSIWYKKFKVRICKVERDYGFESFNLKK